MSPLSLIVVSLAAFGASWALVRLWIGFSLRAKIVDIPNARSSHTRVTPRGGGVGVVVTVLAGGAILAALGLAGDATGLAWAGGLALFIAAISFIDDLRPLPSVLRLACHLAVAGLAVWKLGAFPVVVLPWIGSLELAPWMLAALTAVWIVGLTNVYNFMDGIDGIAGVQGIVAGLAWAVIGWTVGLSDGSTVGLLDGLTPTPAGGLPLTTHNSPVTAVAALLAAACGGFLVHNWSPARVFMGDVGSAFLGFCFAVLPLLALRGVGEAATEGVAVTGRADLTAALPWFALAVVWPFVGDGLFTFIRRIKHRENVLQAHRSHIYQRLIIAGWNHAPVSRIYAGWAVLGALLGTICITKGNAAQFWLILGLVISVLSMFAFVKREERSVAAREAASGKREREEVPSTALPLASLPLPGVAAPPRVTATLPLASSPLAGAGANEPRTRLHLSPPHMGTDELRFVLEAFASNWVAPAGPHLPAFEREFAALIGVKHAVAVDSGTAALHLAMRCVGVQRGDEVFVSTFTFAASANPAVFEGARPVFIDSESTSWNMDPALLARALQDRAARGKLPRAVVLVHVYGESADVDAIHALCQRYDVPLVEDAAEAVGATYKGRYVGTTGLLGAFSFNGNKIITSSGGGMLVSNDQKLIDHAHKLATQARDPAPHYEHSTIGYNYRLSNVLAGIGRGQLHVLSDHVRARRRIFAAYHEALSSLPGVSFMPEAPWGRCTRWLTCLTIDPAQSGGMDREKVRLALEAENIEARPVWKPLHLQPVFQQMGCETFGGGVAERLFEQGLCLPSGSAMSVRDIDRVVDVVRSCFAERGKG